MTEISRPCPGSRANNESRGSTGKLGILIRDKMPDLEKIKMKRLCFLAELRKGHERPLSVKIFT